ncbi:MAG: DUF481 domain-containing protein [Gemmatimonadales bacterium]|nr:DUF481 domain-containing protein [Gemmatimonadales bacterium]
MRLFALLLLLAGTGLCAPEVLQAQVPAAGPAARPPARPIRVFLDCQQVDCDMDYNKTEIPFVDHVRSREDADVHILVTEQSTGGGGDEYTAAFIGVGRFAGRRDTLRYYSRQDATDDAIRVGLARMFKLGLMRYVAGTPAAERLTISYAPAKPEDAAGTARQRDPWNYWVFRARASSFFQGETSSNSIRLSSGISANRTTEDWKLNLSLNGNYSENNFEIDSATSIKSTSKNYNATALAARSIGRHWAAGAEASASRSTYSNQALALRFAPGVEFDLFPYAESTRRQFTLRYNIGVNRFKYDEETIFLKTRETLLDESLTASLDTRQPWGSVSLSLEGAHYLDNFARNRVELFSNFDVRLVKGLSVNFFGSVSRVRDQRYLPAGGATPEEVLLRQRALATNYRYFGSVGLSYSFGSIFNNVVNPRFGGSGGRTFFFN